MGRSLAGGKAGWSRRRSSFVGVAVALSALSILGACFGSEEPLPPFPTPEPERRYVRTVAAGGEAVREPGRSVTVGTRLLSAKGRPVVAAPVRLEMPSSGVFPVFCFGCPWPPPCATDDEAVTGSDGRFALALCRPRRDLLVTSPRPEPNERVALPLFLKHDRTLLPVLRMWDPRITFDLRRGRVEWSELPIRGYGALDHYDLTFRSDEGRDAIVNAIWYAFDAGPLEIVDPRVLEDSSGAIVVSAETRMRLRRPCRPSCGNVFHPSFTARPVPYTGPGAPPSRGAPCFVGPLGGRRIVDGCYLTDGRFSRQGIDQHCPADLGCGLEPRWVGVDLGSARRVDLVVARGCSFCTVSVSLDGRRWVRLRETGYDGSTEGVSLHDPEGRLRIRYLRATDAERLYELSAW